MPPATVRAEIAETFTRFHIIVNGDDGPDQNKRQAILTMVEQLAGQGVGLADIGRMLPGRAMRSVEGLVEDKEALGKALSHAYPGIDVPRYFRERPLLDRKTGHTYVLTQDVGSKDRVLARGVGGSFSRCCRNVSKSGIRRGVVALAG